MSEFQPSRRKSDLADVVEMLLDKGVVINADIAVSIGDTQLLGVQVRAAIASFETAAKYGLEFPEGTDMRRVAEAVDRPEIAEEDRPRPAVDPTRGVNVTAVTEAADVERCLAVTEGGERCSREAGEDGFCYQHDESDEIVSDPEELTREVRIEDGGGGKGGNEGGERFGDDEGSLLGGDDGGLLGGDDGGLLGGDERGTERLGARPNPDVPETDAIDIGGDDGSNGDRDDADGGADGPNERGSAESNDDADEGGDA